MKEITWGFIAGTPFGFGICYLVGATLTYGRVWIVMAVGLMLLARGVKFVLDKKLSVQGL